ncbi:MAG: selenium-dependent molybdenum cofactor biosynthesis protein YqeB [Candidatus Dormibacteria bacterium]
MRAGTGPTELAREWLATPGSATTALVGVRGAGDLATGVIHRLRRAGFQVVATELPQPTVLRRTVAFASAVWEGRMEVEEVTAVRVDGRDAMAAALGRGQVAIVVDPDAELLLGLRPQVLIDATMVKRNCGTLRTDAPVVIALGPGFTAGDDVDAVIETNRGHDLGRVLLRGTALPDTGIPAPVGGHAANRVLRAPRAGRFLGCQQIGEAVAAGATVATVEGEPVISGIAGILRGLLHDGVEVTGNMKVGDVDPRAIPSHCFTISDKARAVGGGVLEAILLLSLQATGGQIGEGGSSPLTAANGSAPGC